MRYLLKHIGESCMFEMLVSQVKSTDEKIEKDVTEFDILDAEGKLESSLNLLTSMIQKEDSLNDLKDLKEHLSNDTTTAVLKLAQKDLLVIGVDCESNESAIADIEKFIDHIESSEEAIDPLKVAIGVFLVIDLIYTYYVFFDSANWIRRKIGYMTNKTIGEPNVKKFEKTTEMVSYQQFDKFIKSATKALDILKSDSLQKRVGSKTFDAMESALKVGGVELFDKGDYTPNTIKKLEPKEQSVKQAGWTMVNIKDGLKSLIELSKVLGEFSSVSRQAKSQQTTLKESKDVENSKEVVAKEKAAAANIKRLGKDTVKMIKSYVRAFRQAYAVFEK